MSLSITREDDSIFVFDAVVEHNITMVNTITSNPVDRNRLINQTNDHIHLDPIRITFTGYISDYSLSNSPVRRVIGVFKETDRLGVEDATEELKKMRNDRELFTAIVDDVSYENCAFANLETPRDKDLDGALKVIGQIQQLDIIESQTTTVAAADVEPEVADPAASKIAKGTAAVKKVSTLVKTVAGIADTVKTAATTLKGFL